MNLTGKRWGGHNQNGWIDTLRRLLMVYPVNGYLRCRLVTVPLGMLLVDAPTTPKGGFVGLSLDDDRTTPCIM